jgi:hypothetical protein
MGSGAGDATKPSKDLIREMVAALTFGPVHARGRRSGDERVGVVKRRGNKVREEKCIVGNWKNLGMWICTVVELFFSANIRHKIIYVSPV